MPAYPIPKSKIDPSHEDLSPRRHLFQQFLLGSFKEKGPGIYTVTSGSNAPKYGLQAGETYSCTWRRGEFFHALV